jgi:mRNA interferase YafQ
MLYLKSLEFNACYVFHAKRRGKDLDKLKAVIAHLVMQNPLPRYYYDHKLKGEFLDCRECHIATNWLLIYSINGDSLILMRTGTHSDLLNK